MKKTITFLITILMVLTLTACSTGGSSSTGSNNTGSAAQTVASGSDAAGVEPTSVKTAAEALAENSETHADTGDYTYDAAAAVTITMDGQTIQVSGDGVTVEGSRATITEAGTYILSGSLADGQIVVNTQSKDLVRLVLNGVNIQSSNSAPLYIANAKKVVVVLADQSENLLSDGNNYIFAIPADEEPNAAIFSKADLSIAGSGSLAVNGNFHDGISSKDGLVIAGGNITVNAVDDGLRGKDYLVMENGALTVFAGGDGLKSDNDAEAEKGFISIAGGTLQVTAGGDAINALTDAAITGGTINLTSGGGSASQVNEDISSKGIKGAVGVNIDGGDITISSADDAVHSNGAIVINGGTIRIAAADDGMHADQTLTVNGGNIQVTQSYEGLESAVITINDGTIQIGASDDGVNVAGGNDASGMGPGMKPGGGPGQDAYTYSGDYYLYINGGYLYVDSRGDGIDVNGAIEMTGGLVVVSGPTENMNGALDYDGGFRMTGGFIAAAGSSGMAQAPDSSSSQPSVMIYLTATQPAGTLVNIQNQAGESILTFAPAKEYQSIAFSSPSLVQGETYTVFTGGQTTATALDGLFQDGTYSSGSQAVAFNISGMVTTVGTGGGMGPGGGGPGGRPGQRP
ncbi:MAG: carbohydrate-binding domain-containing protein [Anaerolineaceae bacterium]